MFCFIYSSIPFQATSLSSLGNYVYKFDGYCSSLLKNIDGYIYGLIERWIES